MQISTLAKITKITYNASFNICQLLKPSFFTSAETILLIFHAITDTTVNLSSEGIGENLSWLIYEASAAIDAPTKIECERRGGDISQSRAVGTVPT